MIKLTDVELLESILEVQVGNKHIDFHNEYTFVKINFGIEQERIMEFTFREDKTNNNVILQFNGASIVKFEMGLGVANSYVLDQFYRGRYDFGGELFDINENGERYFYLNFYEGEYFEIFAKDVFLIEPNV
jgi:hypothetical protein